MVCAGWVYTGFAFTRLIDVQCACTTDIRQLSANDYVDLNGQITMQHVKKFLCMVEKVIQKSRKTNLLFYEWMRVVVLKI